MAKVFLYRCFKYRMCISPLTPQKDTNSAEPGWEGKISLVHTVSVVFRFTEHPLGHENALEVLKIAESYHWIFP